jgi:hypothetical protein
MTSRKAASDFGEELMGQSPGPGRLNHTSARTRGKLLSRAVLMFNSQRILEPPFSVDEVSAIITGLLVSEVRAR